MAFLPERIILALVWLICIGGLLMVPKHKRREAQMAFLFMQFLNWILGLIVVQEGWLNYPVRELQKNLTSFTFEFLAYPTIGVYMNVFYPEGRGKAAQFFYMLMFPIGLTIPEVLIEKYTQLIDYLSWKWYWTFLSVWGTLYLSRLFYSWYFRINNRYRRTKIS